MPSALMAIVELARRLARDATVRISVEDLQLDRATFVATADAALHTVAWALVPRRRTPPVTARLREAVKIVTLVEPVRGIFV